VNHDDEHDYRVFVASRGDPLRRLGYLICGDWHLAEDATQTTLAKLYTAWPRLHRSGGVDAYARRILVRAVVDERRRAWFRRERVSDVVPERSRPDDNEATADRLLVRDALASMPARQRAAIVLRYWEDLSVEATAGLLDCPTGTVKSLTARGLQTLRGLLMSAGVHSDQSSSVDVKERGDV
jgi:RNA polymerase sigma-70 factor (sigma-E family)